MFRTGFFKGGDKLNSISTADTQNSTINHYSQVAKVSDDVIDALLAEAND
jgi:hypothetical protein